MDFKITTKKVTRDNEGYIAMIKMSIPQEDIAIINTYTPNNRNSKTTQKQKLTELKGETDSSTIVGDLTYSTFNNE